MMQPVDVTDIPAKQKFSGKHNLARITTTGVCKMVEMMSMSFKDRSIPSRVCVKQSSMHMTIAIVAMPTIMPELETSTGQKSADKLWAIGTAPSAHMLMEPEAMTRAATVASAKDPKRSAPIPAMSPT